MQTIELDCTPAMSQHSVNTEPFVQTQRGVNHTEGVWPADFKSQEVQERQRYVRRIMNEESYTSTVVRMQGVSRIAKHGFEKVSLLPLAP